MIIMITYIIIYIIYIYMRVYICIYIYTWITVWPFFSDHLAGYCRIWRNDQFFRSYARIWPYVASSGKLKDIWSNLGSKVHRFIPDILESNRKGSIHMFSVRSDSSPWHTKSYGQEQGTKQCATEFAAPKCTIQSQFHSMVCWPAFFDYYLWSCCL